MIRRRFVFYGRVQGVGFRWRAKTAADAMGCTGWVKNEYDGSVTMELQGTEAQIDRVIMAIECSAYIRIENLSVENLPVNLKEGRFRTEW